MNLQLNSEIVLVVLYGFFIDNTEIPAAQETPCSSRDEPCLEHKVLLKGSGHAEEEEKKTRFSAFSSGIEMVVGASFIASIYMVTFESQYVNIETSTSIFIET